MKNRGRITDKKLDVDSLLGETYDPTMGCTVAFIGTIRKNGEAGTVDGLLYDAYVPLAEKKMLQVEQEVKEAFPGGKIVMQHRIGEVKVGEITVVVAASAPHRAEAFDACRMGIERIKQEVPIWKKEHLAHGGESWVEGEVAHAGRKKRSRSR